MKCSLTDGTPQDTASNTIITKSKPSDFPSYLRQKLSSVQTIKRHEVNTEATTNQICPKCGRTEVRFSAVQLRSADEGSTIFYNCDCGFKYVMPVKRLFHNGLLIKGTDGARTTDLTALELWCSPELWIETPIFENFSESEIFDITTSGADLYSAAKCQLSRMMPSLPRSSTLL